jgi:hypothetical protein
MKWKVLAVIVVMLMVTQVAAPSITYMQPTVTYAAEDGGSGGGPWWWGIVTWLVGNCVTSYDSGSWYDRQVCQRAVRMIRWLLWQGDDVLCLGKFYDDANDPTEDNNIALHTCILEKGLPTLHF